MSVSPEVQWQVFRPVLLSSGKAIAARNFVRRSDLFHRLFDPENESGFELLARIFGAFSAMTLDRKRRSRIRVSILWQHLFAASDFCRLGKWSLLGAGKWLRDMDPGEMREGGQDKWSASCLG
jgi:hypothetical protein